MSEKRTVAPTAEPITLVEAKAHCVIETNAYNDVVTDKIKSAREWVEDYTGRALVYQTWRTRLDRFPCGPTYKDRLIYINHPPLVSVSSIQYVDTNGDTQTLSTDYYDVDTDSEPGRIAEAYGYSWPDTLEQIQAVTITSIHGYYNPSASPEESTSLIPQAIRDAISILVAELYQNRQRTVLGLEKQVLDAAESLLFRHRVQSIIR